MRCPKPLPVAAGNLLVAVLLLGTGGCSTSSGKAGLTADGRLRVVAAESAWGSIAAALGGSRVDVTDIVTNPDADPHDYEPTASDARSIAEAGLVVVNGLGYDAWASKSVAANPSSRRVVLDVGRLTDHTAGDNPHRWYYPADVATVIRQITADYQRLDPRHTAYYAARRHTFETTTLAGYHRLLAGIRHRFGGTRVGASESIFVGLAEATHLDLVTPASFLVGVSEGADITARDKTTADRQIARREISVFVFNSQNATPDVQRLVTAARSRNIPVVTITETLSPAGATFEQWQVAQLRDLDAALHRATGR